MQQWSLLISIIRNRNQAVRATVQTICFRFTCFDARNLSIRQRNFFANEIIEKIIRCNFDTVMSHYKHASQTPKFLLPLVFSKNCNNRLMRQCEPWVVLDFAKVLQDHCNRKCHMQLSLILTEVNKVTSLAIATRWYKELKNSSLWRKARWGFTVLLSFFYK